MGAPFQAPAAHQKLLKARTKEETDTAKACKRIWKVKVPLKLRIFSKLLLRLVTRAYRKRWQPDAPAECIMYDRNTENVPHLFFDCAFAERMWENQQIIRWNFHQLRDSGVTSGTTEVVAHWSWYKSGQCSG